VPAVQRDDRDDEFRRVAKRRVEESANGRPGSVRQFFGAKTDNPGEWNQRDRGENEHRDGVRGHLLDDP
jgi:hypothetical protein